METIMTIFGIALCAVILGAFVFAFYHRVIKNEKADLTKRK